MAPVKQELADQYLLMIYQNEAELGKIDAATGKKMMEEYGAFTQSIIQSGNFKAGDALQSTTDRDHQWRSRRRMRPMVRSRKPGALGGYYLVEAKDLDAAVRHCRTHSRRQDGFDRGSARSGSKLTAIAVISGIAIRDEPGIRDSGFVLRTLRNDARPHDTDRNRKNIPGRGGSGAGNADPPGRPISISPKMRCQDAFATALERWPVADPPSNPRAWLSMSGATRRSTDPPEHRVSRKQTELADELRSMPRPPTKLPI